MSDHGPPLCKVCGHRHRWEDEHVWGRAPVSTFMQRSATRKAKVVQSVGRKKREVEAIILREDARLEKQRARTARWRARHKGK